MLRKNRQQHEGVQRSPAQNHYRKCTSTPWISNWAPEPSPSPCVPQGAGDVDEAVPNWSPPLATCATTAPSPRPCAWSCLAPNHGTPSATPPGGLGSRASEVLEEPDTDEEARAATLPTEAAEPAPEKTREELLAEDVIAKSYENTAVPPTDFRGTAASPARRGRRGRAFDFPVDYTLWPSLGPMAQHAPTIPSQRLSSTSGDAHGTRERFCQPGRLAQRRAPQRPGSPKRYARVHAP